VSRFNSVFECGKRVLGAGTTVIWLSLKSSSLRTSHRITAFIVERVCCRRQLAATLEQANDTKDLNRVQRPLAAGGKVVGKPVDYFATAG
jgi:hypothetical protein